MYDLASGVGKRFESMAPGFTVVIERDEEGYLIASVPELPGCHTQARTMDELLERAREAIQLCLAAAPSNHSATD